MSSRYIMIDDRVEITKSTIKLDGRSYRVSNIESFYMDHEKPRTQFYTVLSVIFGLIFLFGYSLGATFFMWLSGPFLAVSLFKLWLSKVTWHRLYICYNTKEVEAFACTDIYYMDRVEEAIDMAIMENEESGFY